MQGNTFSRYLFCGIIPGMNDGQAIQPAPQNPQPQGTGQPQNPLPQGATFSGFQYTQVNQPHIPPEAWTEKAVMDFHEKSLALNKHQISSFDAQNKRLHTQTMFGSAIIAIIILCGLFFMWKGIPGGKEIILGTAGFIAGFLAGKGAK